MIFQYREKHIRYKRDGSGPVLVLLHGFLETLEMWEELVPCFTDSFEIIRIDLPGHGGSDVYDDTHTMEFMAGVVEALAEHLDLGDIHILGHSMGGYVSLAFAELFPQRLQSVTLLNSTTEADNEERLANRKRALKIVEQNKALFIKSSIPNLFSPDNRTRLKKKIERYQAKAMGMRSEGILAAIRGMMSRTDKTSVLSAFNGNKIWICGKEDPLITVDQCVSLAKKTGAKLYSVEGGHMLVEENFLEIVKIMHFIE